MLLGGLFVFAFVIFLIIFFFFFFFEEGVGCCCCLFVFATISSVSAPLHVHLPNYCSFSEEVGAGEYESKC